MNASAVSYASETDVEITPAMIEAGTAVLCRMTTYIADEEYWAEEIYKAMLAVSPRRRPGSDISHEAGPQ